jgi:hypothetical protein
MTDLQLYILVAIPLVGILTNTGLFLHLSGRVDWLAERLDARVDQVADRFDARLNQAVDSLHTDMKDLNKTMTALEINVAILKDKVGM